MTFCDSLKNHLFAYDFAVYMKCESSLKGKKECRLQKARKTL